MNHISLLVKDLLPREETFRVVDCGAKGGTEEAVWQCVSDRLALHGFDPDEEECLRLNNQSEANGKRHRYHPFCLAGKDEEGRPFYITKQIYSNSLYPPNMELLSRVRHTEGNGVLSPVENLTVERTISLKTTTLDTWSETSGVDEADFIKLDVQGAELEVLQGGSKLLGGVLGLELEVCFSPVYIGQALFSDVDHFLREQGFTFFTFKFTETGHFLGRVASPVNVTMAGNALIAPQLCGQMISANALYLLDPLDSSLDRRLVPSSIQMLKLACIAEIHGQIEYAFELLTAVHSLYIQTGDRRSAAKVAAVFTEASKSYSA